ncbi:hypothetical protein AB834_00160 [PVC group bacterium (ex Bugula neritina AB1)]|nr:hypothetical protein AB834_00160 [PVC group bacterium (ex Bugula neritina AB1)]
MVRDREREFVNKGNSVAFNPRKTFSLTMNEEEFLLLCELSEKTSRSKASVLREGMKVLKKSLK